MKATFYGIPCYYREKDNYLEGRNIFYELLLNITCILHCGFSFISEGLFGVGLDFPIYIEDDK